MNMGGKARQGKMSTRVNSFKKLMVVNVLKEKENFQTIIGRIIIIILQPGRVNNMSRKIGRLSQEEILTW